MSQSRASLTPKKWGNLGWPCPSGAAIQLRARTSAGLLLNCVVHYHRKPLTSSVRTGIQTGTGLVLHKYKAALKIFKAANANKRLNNAKYPDPIDLTRLAADLTTALLQVLPRTYPWSFKAVVIVPAYGTPGSLFWHGWPPWRGVKSGSWQSEFVGLVASGGHVIFDHLHVPIGIDVNLPPHPFAVKLHILVALPCVLTCNRRLSDCDACKEGE